MDNGNENIKGVSLYFHSNPFNLIINANSQRYFKCWCKYNVANVVAREPIGAVRYQRLGSKLNIYDGKGNIISIYNNGIAYNSELTERTA